MQIVARVPAILTAVVALAVSAAPVGSAALSKGSKGIVTDNKDPDKLGAVTAIVYNGHAGLGANVRALKRYRQS